MKRRDLLKALIVLPIATFFYPLPFSEGDAQEAEPLFLMNTVIAGFRYYEGEKVWSRLGPDQQLRLIREPSNPYDSMAIEVFHEKDKLGYIPREDNPALALLIDQGVRLRAKISWLRQRDDPAGRIGIQIEVLV